MKESAEPGVVPVASAITHHFEAPDPGEVVLTPAPVAGEPVVRPTPPRPWYQLIWGQWPLFVTLVVVITGVAVAGASHWRRGSTIAGAGILLAAVLRLVLSNEAAGLLYTRRRWFDVLLYALLGASIIMLAWIISPTRK